MIQDLEIISNVFDLRGITVIDGFGALSLLCLIKARLKVGGESVYVLVQDTYACRYLRDIGFFQEVKRGAPHLFVNDDVLNAKSALPPDTILELQTIGYRGAEKRILEHLYGALQRQGFTENLCSYLGWTVGELADNAHTHAGGPCYLAITSLHGESQETKFLSIAIGDTGDGIPNSLKKNPLYSPLDDRQAFLMAFKSNVTSWSHDADRGRGLNDLLAIGKGNNAWVRVETNDMSLFFDFRRELPRIEYMPVTKINGTRVSLVLIDSKFESVSKKIIDDLIDHELE